MGTMQQLRDHVSYLYGYLQGRTFAIPRSPAALYGLLVSKITSLIALPLPLLSFLALPFFGGSSTTINVLVFYLTWSALVVSYDQLTLEVGGTLLARLFCFLIPAVAFLAFDCALPNVSRKIKARGRSQLPLTLGRDKVMIIVAVATFNILLSVMVQGLLEVVITRVFHLRSILRVTALVPLPWNLVKDIAKGIIIRGILRYFIHRYILHTYASPLRTWHLDWQHSVHLPFSLVAAYDHPINFLVSEWLPIFLPAYLFRFHVLAWHVLVAFASLEELLVFSGYSVLPSTIILPGMARRTEAHFESVQSQDVAGNFGHLGVLDFVCGTTVDDEVDVVDDMRSEAKKHRVEQRAEGAVKSALASLRDDKLDATARTTKRPVGSDHDKDRGADQQADEEPPPKPLLRRSRRRHQG